MTMTSSEPRVERTQLGVAPLDEEPRCSRPPAVFELESHDDAPIWEAFAPQVDLAPGPEGDPRVGVLGPDVHPLVTPDPERRQDGLERSPGSGGLVERPVPVGFGMDVDDTGVFELPKPPDQEGTRQPGCSGGDLVEGAAAVEDVADDDRGPPLGEDLRSSRDRTVLAVGAHAAIVAARAALG